MSVYIVLNHVKLTQITSRSVRHQSRFRLVSSSHPNRQFLNEQSQADLERTATRPIGISAHRQALLWMHYKLVC
jgi:hypothetical protein